jgi:hypothetical protein
MRPAGQRWLRLDLPVWVAFVVMLGFGMLILRQDDARAHPWTDQQGGLQLRYPVGWLPTPGSKALLDLQDPFSGGPLPVRVIVTRTSTAANRSLAEIVNEVVLAHSQDRTLYRVLSLEAARIGDSEARAIEYAYVADPHEAVLTAQRLPVVLRGVEVVAVQGTTLYSIDFSAPSETFAGQRRVFDRILRESKL